MSYCHGIGLVNALGADNAGILASLHREASGLSATHDWLSGGAPTYIGAITADLPEIDDLFIQHRTRNNQILLACLQQIETVVADLIAFYGHDRCAIIMGTSTSGIYEAEQAVAHTIQQHSLLAPFYYQYQRLSDPSDFLAAYLKVSGPAYTISTACSSSAKAVLSGMKIIESGLADMAIVGGADSLCKMAINGFQSLESISATKCVPFGAARDGINIGEAGGLMVLAKDPAGIKMLGAGASSDAWHISAPHPEGVGAIQAMQNALADAGLEAGDVGYINLHGTATLLNDQAESKAVYQIFNDSVPASSTKHLTGHTLGAAGITELGLCYLILTHSCALPRQIFTDCSPRDLTLAPIQLVESSYFLKKPVLMSNSFAFGGNNMSLIIGSAHV